MLSPNLWRSRAICMLPVIVLAQFRVTALVAAQNELHSDVPCSHPRIIAGHALADLPAKVQSQIHKAVDPALERIITDPGMGLTETVASSVPLNAIELSRPAGSSGVYIVARDDPGFGSNGFNWIVELAPNGSRLLLSDKAARVSGGFGVELLSHKGIAYPDLMIAGKGYKEGGGAEGEPGCFRYLSRLYDQVTCPAMCNENLNSR